MKTLLLVMTLFALSLATGNAQAGNCDTHTSEKKEESSGI